MFCALYVQFCWLHNSDSSPFAFTIRFGYTHRDHLLELQTEADFSLFIFCSTNVLLLQSYYNVTLFVICVYTVHVFDVLLAFEY